MIRTKFLPTCVSLVLAFLVIAAPSPTGAQPGPGGAPSHRPRQPPDTALTPAAAQNEIATPADDHTQILVNHKTHVVRILIDGKDILTIDAKGLHVTGDIDYSGIITDTGAATHAKAEPDAK